MKERHEAEEMTSHLHKWISQCNDDEKKAESLQRIKKLSNRFNLSSTFATEANRKKLRKDLEDLKSDLVKHYGPVPPMDKEKGLNSSSGESSMKEMSPPKGGNEPDNCILVLPDPSTEASSNPGSLSNQPVRPVNLPIPFHPLASDQSILLSSPIPSENSSTYTKPSYYTTSPNPQPYSPQSSQTSPLIQDSLVPQPLQPQQKPLQPLLPLPPQQQQQQQPQQQPLPQQLPLPLFNPGGRSSGIRQSSSANSPLSSSPSESKKKTIVSSRSGSPRPNSPSQRSPLSPLISSNSSGYGNSNLPGQIQASQSQTTKHTVNSLIPPPTNSSLPPAPTIPASNAPTNVPTKQATSTIHTSDSMQSTFASTTATMGDSGINSTLSMSSIGTYNDNTLLTSSLGQTVSQPTSINSSENINTPPTNTIASSPPPPTTTTSINQVVSIISGSSTAPSTAPSPFTTAPTTAPTTNGNNVSLIATPSNVSTPTSNQSLEQREETISNEVRDSKSHEDGHCKGSRPQPPKKEENEAAVTTVDSTNPNKTASLLPEQNVNQPPNQSGVGNGMPTFSDTLIPTQPITGDKKDGDQHQSKYGCSYHVCVDNMKALPDKFPKRNYQGPPPKL